MRVPLGRLAGAALILTLGLSLAGAGPARAQPEPTAITIHLAQCPAGYDGGDPFTDCHPNGIPGVIFEWTNDNPGPPQLFKTNGEEVAYYADLLVSRPEYITERPPFALASYAASCGEE